MSTAYTSNLSPANRSAGEYLLGVMWRASDMSKNALLKLAVSFDGLKKYYDTNYPTFIEYLGEQLNNHEVNTLSGIAQEVGAQTGDAYPSPSLWINKLIGLGYADQSTLSIASKAVGDTVSQVGSMLANLGQWTVIILVGLAGALVWFYFEDFKEVGRSYVKGLKK